MLLTVSFEHWWQEIDQRPKDEIPHPLGLMLKGIVSALLQQTFAIGVTTSEVGLLKQHVVEGVLITPDTRPPNPHFPPKIQLDPKGYEFVVFVPTSKKYRQFVVLVPKGTNLQALGEHYGEGVIATRLYDIP